MGDDRRVSPGVFTVQAHAPVGKRHQANAFVEPPVGTCAGNQQSAALRESLGSFVLQNDTEHCGLDGVQRCAVQALLCKER